MTTTMWKNTRNKCWNWCKYDKLTHTMFQTQYCSRFITHISSQRHTQHFDARQNTGLLSNIKNIANKKETDFPFFLHQHYFLSKNMRIYTRHYLNFRINNSFTYYKIMILTYVYIPIGLCFHQIHNILSHSTSILQWLQYTQAHKHTQKRRTLHSIIFCHKTWLTNHSRSHS